MKIFVNSSQVFSRLITHYYFKKPAIILMAGFNNDQTILLER